MEKENRCECLSWFQYHRGACKNPRMLCNNKWVFDFVTELCTCDYWFKKKDNSCFSDLEICKINNSYYDEYAKQCNCSNWFVAYNNSCLTNKEICKIDYSIYNSLNNSCECEKNYKFYEWNCKDEWYIIEQNKLKEEQLKITKQLELDKKRTLSQKNAIRVAESYIDYTGFSKNWLIKQLKF